MEVDASTVVYLIAIVVYFLYSVFFNKKNPEQDLPEEEGEDNSPPRKTVSFDELLKEIRREQGERERDLTGSEPQEREAQSPEPRAGEVHRPERREPEIHRHKPREREVYKPDPVPARQAYENGERTSRYEDAAREYHQNPYKTFERQPLVKLDDQVDIESTEKILGEVEDEYSSANPYGAILKNPETVRDAIVVAEILQRKHF